MKNAIFIEVTGMPQDDEAARAKLGSNLEGLFKEFSPEVLIPVVVKFLEEQGWTKSDTLVIKLFISMLSNKEQDIVGRIQNMVNSRYFPCFRTVHIIFAHSSVYSA